MSLPLTGVTCANCSTAVERAFKIANGVKRALVNLSSERVTVDFDPQVST
ncbi:MAG: hypothetical protein CVU46_02010 [Chloroflexi bacterium HGW-Chloroflexi-8]|nr:MAG: hypothetical protein CVU46_02010 [Chloroflexi bacterium HGW-Chloroflexi-8]